MDLHEKTIEEIKKVDEHISNLEAKADEQAKLNGKVHDELKTELKNAQDQYVKMKERLDTLETEAKRLKGGAEKAKSFKSLLSDAIEENHEAIQNYKSTGRFEMELKDVHASKIHQKSSITLDNSDGSIVPADYRPGIVHDPDRQVHVRQFLQTASTNSNNVPFVFEDDYTDGTDITGEGSLKPESTAELVLKNAPVVKIAAHMKVAEEQLEDVAGLSGYLTTRGTTKYRLKEDSQLLYGTGSNGQLEGLTVAASDYSRVLSNSTASNEYDVLLDAIAQLAGREFVASGIMMNPVDWYNLLRAKDTGGNYILPDAVRFGVSPAQVDGVPIIRNTAIEAGDFLVANFAQMATLYDRRGVNVRFYDQNEDDAIKNLVTIVIEGRLALPIYLPTAGVYGDFAETITS